MALPLKQMFFQKIKWNRFFQHFFKFLRLKFERFHNFIDEIVKLLKFQTQKLKKVQKKSVPLNFLEKHLF